MPEEIYYEVKVENIFEGPMDLLIHLIKKNQVDIYDIPIALIIDQYLAYVEWMKAMNIDFAGDFILMAATLTHIKSKMLLPAHKDDDGESDDPRMEIARPLAEYLQMKSAAGQLAQRPFLGEDIFLRNPSKEEFQQNREDELIKADLFELIQAFQKVLEKIPEDHKVEFTSERISIKDKMSQIVDLLEKQGSAAFDELFSSYMDKSEVVVTFLAILEMAKLCLIEITQHVQTGVIRLFYL